MTAILRFVLVIACLLTCYYTLHKIRKSQMQIEDSVFWIIISGLLVLVSIFPDIAYFASDLLGIGAPVNFVFLAMIFILLYKVFLMSVRISQLEYRVKNLVQQIAIKNHELEKKNGDIGCR
ncbi:MAG: DUF2304 domain-containing protein [Eubacterium sp.]|nr:DUF2304 domain-containing protein [Eubacterium sp.]